MTAKEASLKLKNGEITRNDLKYHIPDCNEFFTEWPENTYKTVEEARKSNARICDRICAIFPVEWVCVDRNGTKIWTIIYRYGAQRYIICK